MNIKKSIEFANKNPVSWVSSIENDQARVRALGMWFADETGYYFQINAGTDMYKQLQENPKGRSRILGTRRDVRNHDEGSWKSGIPRRH